MAGRSEESDSLKKELDTVKVSLKEKDEHISKLEGNLKEEKQKCVVGIFSTCA